MILPPFVDSMIIYTEMPTDSTKKLLELVNAVNSQDTKSIHKNQLHYCTLTVNYLNGKSREIIPLTIPTKIR